MTRLEALKELAAKVEAGEWYPGLAQSSVGGVQNYHNALNAFDGSLDAALALHEAVLPEWCWSVDRLGQAIVWYPWVEGDSIMHEAGGNDGAGDWRLGPARAWLLAILRALIAQEEQ